MAITERAVQQYEYYRPTLAEQKINPLDMSVPEHIRNNPFFKGLVNQLIEPFKFISVFEDGGQPYSPAEGKRVGQFRAEMEQVLYRYSRDYLETNPNSQTKEQRQGWLNLVELSPKILQAFIDPKNHIGLVQKKEALNLAAVAFHIVQFPDTQVTLSTGLGGSDDEWTTARLNAYAIPSTKIYDSLQNIYEERRTKARNQASVNKAFDLYKTQVGGRELTKDEKRYVVSSIPKDENNQPTNLTEEEKSNAYRKLGVLTRLPNIRFFFAYNAAIAINQTMNKDRVKLRTAENVQSLREYVTNYHPEAAKDTNYLTDKPWDEHPLLTRLGSAYLVSKLKNCPDEAVKQEVSDLKKIGHNKGGENGGDQAERYTAMHPPIFSDRLDLPHLGLLQGVTTNPEINITIGGRTERAFCAARLYLSETANAADFEEFVRTLKDNLAPDDGKDIDEELSSIRAWRNRVEIAREARFSTRLDTACMPPEDYPIHGISLITDIGFGNPPYYTNQYDRPQGIDLGVHLAELELQLSQLESGQFEQETILRGTIYDIKALMKDMAQTTQPYETN